jgi:uncharacterized membrane protein
MVTSSRKQSRLDLWTARLTRWLSRLVHGLSRHWLLLANLAIGLYVALPFLAPILLNAGHERAGNLVYLLFRPLCHQLPERSFFLFGPHWVYSLSDLQQRTGLELVPLRFVGAPDLGYKLAVCERDTAIYAAMLLAGLAYGLVRNWLKPLPFKAFLALIAPMAVDGFGQLFSLWDSTWLTRVVTGGLFGLATIWLCYPHINRGMAEVQRSCDVRPSPPRALL